MYLIVGLGNPGQKYHNTKHNIGFMCIDFISQVFNIPVNKTKHDAVIGEGKIGNEKVILAKPHTFMNLSGQSVDVIARWNDISPKNIIILYDDTSIDVGKIRIREEGSAGGHNGIKSIIQSIKTDVFPRVRVGIGQPPEKMDLADYVLSKIPKEERDAIFNEIQNASYAVEMIVNGEIQRAMNKYN